MVQSYSERIYENKYKINSPHVPGRVERLLRERELRKSSRASQPNKATEDNNNKKGTPPSEKDVCLRKDDYSRVCKVEPYLKEGSVARIQDKGREKQIERPSSRILVVANRLPVSAVRRGEDSWSLEKSAGGLVSSLMGVEFEKRWIGWAGINVPDEIGQTTLTQALAEKKCIPVFLDEEIVQQYYNGYCNNILWPLFHYLGLPQEDQLATTCSFQSQFAAYQKANQMFADVVNKHYEEGDVVWCHDYHLMFLPKCLKEYNRSMKVGWFLHTPFPSSEIHRTLPSRSELLHSVLAADLVGFHTYDYARHFVSACTRILGLEGTPEGVEDQGRLTRVAAFPVGIDSWRFMDAVRLPEIEEQINDLKKRFGVKKVILGVDRLDMIKGIPQKILAFEKFLEENPNWRDKVVLLQVAVPTRTDVSQYQKLTSQVHEIVGRINGRFGTMTNVPLLHLKIFCSDVALITSLRDGMNLVSYEFVACQDAKKGVLILSEFAGAAQSLGAGAILVNPWNITEVAAAIGQALNMQPEEREKRHQLNFMHVKVHTSQEWAETFISELNDTVVEVELRTREAKPPFPVNIAVDRYLKSINRLLILGFNATLTEPVDVSGRRGDQIKEMELKLHPDLKEPLRALCNDPKTITLVLSGSEKSILDDNFGQLDMWLAAENGMFFRHTEREWTTTMHEDLNLEWIDSVKHVFEYFTERTPRSHFVQRETSLVWNYKYADVEFGRLQARDMLEHLCTGPISNASVDVVQGSHSVEVRTVGSSKGATIRRILGDIFHTKMKISPIDYVLCIGHFLGKDEDVYTFFDVNKKTNTTGGYQSRGKRSRRNESKSSNSRAQRNQPNPEKKIEKLHENPRRSSTERVAWDVLDLKGDNYFSCAVGRNPTKARFLLGSSDEVVSFLKQLADATSASSSSSPCDRYSF